MSTAHEFDDELLSAYLDNEVTAAERALVEERLRTDERARQVLDDLRTASEAVKSLPRPRLGRDLTAAVFNEIDRHAPEVDRARVLTLPVRDGDTTHSSGSSGSRGLIWASLAVAAALLLMVLRGENQAPRGREVVSSEKEIVGVDGEGGATAIQSERDDDRGPQFADVTKQRETSGNTRRGVGEGRDDEPSRVTTEAPGRGIAPPPPGAATPLDADAEAAEEPTSAVAAAIETVRVEVVGDDVAAAFQTALAGAGIELVDDELSADLTADVAELLSGDATDPSEPADAFLVEATSAQIEAVTAALQQRDLSAARPADATTAAAPAAESPRSRAWRTTAGRAQAETAAGAADASGPAEVRGGARDGEVDSTSMKRVLFLLRRAQ